MKTYTKIHARFAKYLAANQHFSVRTKSSYLQIIEYYLEYLEAFDIQRLNDIEITRIVKFARFNNNKEYAASYFNLRMSALRAFYTWAYKNKLCNRHMILEYKKQKLNQRILCNKEENSGVKQIVVLRPEEQSLLLKTLADNDFLSIRNKCIVELILASALSAIEIVSLHIGALNLKKGYIDIVDTTRQRRVGLDLTLCQQSCNAWLKIRNKILSKHHCQFLFFTKNFEPLNKRLLYKIISQYLSQAGISKERLGADVLRQTAICNMFRNKKTIEEVRQLTGVQTLLILEKYRYATE